MMKKDITVYVNSKTSMVDLHSSRLGISGENLQGNLIVKFDDEFVNGTAVLEIQRNNEKYYLVMQKENESYYLPILSSLLSETTTIIMQIRITEGTDNESIPVWKSNKFYLKVEEAINAEIPIPEEYNEWIDIANAKLNEIDNIDIDVNKVENTATVSITKKDGTEKSVEIYDGLKGDKGDKGDTGATGPKGDKGDTGEKGEKGDKGDTGEKGEKGDTGSIGPQGPQGPQGIQGPMGPQGKAFTISKTYSSIPEMNADFNNMEVGDYVMIASSVELEDNAKLYVKGEEEWLFVSDFSGAMGIQGEQGIQGIQGIQGEQGIQGIQGETGNGIATIQKTSTSGLIDTYTITYTDGNTSTFSITNGKDGEDGEVSQEQLDETNSHLDHLSKVSNLFEKITATGTNITLNNTLNTIMKLNLDTTTSSQVTTTGKNKWSLNSSYTTETGNQYVLRDTTIETIPAGTYILSLEKSVDNNVFFTFKGDGGYQKTVNLNNVTSNTAEFTSDVNKAAIYIYGSEATTISEIMVSTSGGDYEPYTGGQPAPSPSYPQEIHTITGNNVITISNSDNTKSQTYSVNLGDIELCKISDYKDILFKNTMDSEYYNSSLELNKWYKLNRISKLILNGTENWQRTLLTGNKYYYQYRPNVEQQTTDGKLLLCNYFKATSTWSEQVVGMWFDSNMIVKTQGSLAGTETADDFKTWLSSHNTTVYYVLATPTYTLLNDTLQTQLDNLQYALAYDTQTNISQTNTDLPFIINAETYVDLTDYVKNTDYASSSTGGIIKTGYSSNIDANGNLYATNLSYTNYQNVGVNHFISKGTLENVLRGYGLIE